MDYNTKCKLNNFLNDLINNNGICYYAELFLEDAKIPLSNQAIKKHIGLKLKIECIHFDNRNKDCCKRDCPLYRIFDLIPLCQFEGK